MISVFVQELFSVLYQKIGQTWHGGMFLKRILKIQSNIKVFKSVRSQSIFRLFLGTLKWYNFSKIVAKHFLFHKLSDKPAISESLAALINNSLSSGVYPQPESWKESVEAPVLKPGKDTTKPVSYRPISLLSNVSKVAEKVVPA